MKRLAMVLAVLGLVAVAPAAATTGDGKPKAGTVIGRIVINTNQVDVNIPIVEGPRNDKSEDGYFPTHYRSTNWVCDGQTVGISAHHYTHHTRWETTAGGPFRNIDKLPDGAAIKVIGYASRWYSGCTAVYRVTGQRSVNCQGDIYGCWPVKQYFGNIRQTKLVLTTCIGDGSFRRVLYAFKSKR